MFLNKKNILTALMLILILILLAAIFSTYKNIFDSDKIASPTLSETEIVGIFNRTEQLQGKIYVSGSMGTTSKINIFSYTPDKNFLNDTNGFELEFGTDNTSAYNFDSNTDTSVYLSEIPDETVNTSQFSLMMSGSEGNVQELTPNWNYVRGPKVSPSGKYLAYFANNGEFPEEELLHPENWFVVILNLETNEDNIVGKGTMPFWGNTDDTLLFFANDGVRFFNQNSFDLDLVIGLAEEAIMNAQMKIGISADGKSLAWAVPSERKLFIYNLEYDTTYPVATLVNEISYSDSTGFFWPVFSPESRYIAIQAVDAADNLDIKFNNSRLMIYDRTDKIFHTIADLSIFDFLRFFTDDWSTR